MRPILPRCPAPQRGFGLASVLMTLAVMGVVSQIAWPALQGSLDRRRLDTLAAAFAHDLQLARSLALNGEQPLRLSVRLDATGSCYVLHQALHDACDCGPGGAHCAGEAEPLRYRWIPRHSRTGIAANVPGVTVHPGEGFVASAGTFRIEQPGSGRGIWYVLSPVARVRTCTKDWPSRALPPCAALPA